MTFRKGTIPHYNKIIQEGTMTKSIRRSLMAGMLGLYSFNCSAVDTSFINNTYNSFTESVADTWNTSKDQDLYVPVLTWHNRLTYDQEHIDKYNEKPWGLGAGVSKYDEYGNWNGLYIMAFKDSFNKWEPIGGYGWEKIWRPFDANKDIKFGLGYTAFITMRDNWSYIPIPAALPLASIGYKDFNFQATYIPGTHNNGNVLFGWLRFTY